MHATLRAAALVALAALPLAAVAGFTRQVVKGPLEDVSADDGRQRGRFRLAMFENDAGRTYERIDAGGLRLDRDDEYHVFLTKSDGTGEADFGAMRVSRFGYGAFRWDTRRDEFPSGVTTIGDYGGGTIELRSGDTVVLTGDVPQFVDLDDDADGAATVGRDRSRLQPVDDTFRGHGVIDARRRNAPAGVREDVRVMCKRMEAGATYTLVAIAEDASETEVGTFTTSDPLGIGGFRLSTQAGDTIPGGGVLALAGLDVEVRDADGAAVLAGTFPTLE